MCDAKAILKDQDLSVCVFYFFSGWLYALIFAMLLPITFNFVFNNRSKQSEFATYAKVSIDTDPLQKIVLSRAASGALRDAHPPTICVQTS